MTQLSRRQFLTARRSKSARPFFKQQLQTAPTINPAYWMFSIGGMVDVPFILAYEDMLELPVVDFPCALGCIGSAVGGAHMAEATWRGVPTVSMLNQINITSSAYYANLYAVDGYKTSIPFERFASAILVYGMNGQPLPAEHGYPARLIVPGLYGYKMPKWIQRVELSDTPVQGFWEGRGWSADGIVQTTSAILSPRTPVRGTVTLQGMAYAGERAIVNVEVSIDGGDWMQIPFSPAERFAWTRWQIDWTPPAPGDYHISVRATDSDGFTQSGAGAAFPNGSSALHSIILHVTSLRVISA